MNQQMKDHIKDKIRECAQHLGQDISEQEVDDIFQNVLNSYTDPNVQAFARSQAGLILPNGT